MKKSILFCTLMNLALFANAQELINLPFEQPTDVIWKGGEKAYFSNMWDTQVITNVSVPTMMIFKPAEGQANGTSVIIAPGGGLYALSIESEGAWVARWLVEKGITAFVLKYRLMPTGEDGVAEMGELSRSDPEKFFAGVQEVIPYSVADGLAAISHVRENAASYGINPEKIGFMGFSAGGAVTMGVGYQYSEKTRPDFLVPVYPWVDVMPVQVPQEDAPPMLIVCATDDPLDLAKGSVELYDSWHEKGVSIGLHMYAKGGHGFGMRKNGNASDTWIERFYDWAVTEGILDN
jgi:acetyl esterase/lipase